MGKSVTITIIIILGLLLYISPAFFLNGTAKKREYVINEHLAKSCSITQREIPKVVSRFIIESEFGFVYPDAVRGIYVTGHSAGGSRFNQLVKLIEKTDLNAMVIDIKDDYGNLTYEPEKDSKFKQIGKNYIKDPKKLLKELEEKEIYPIARIVVFKDSVLANTRHDLSFKEGTTIWRNGRGEAFVNPFLKEVWEYNTQIAIEAAKLGFQEIQFDYVRFPEGFEKKDSILKYGMGDYGKTDNDNVKKRVRAVTDFVEYAKTQLARYNVKVSVDIFGYTATIPEAPGIGQNFLEISKHVDVISSMIYPSHWTSYFGIQKPDLEPYRLVNEYAKVENSKLKQLSNPPLSRPWIQDFTASWLGSGNYKNYEKAEIEAQIRALNDQGIQEFLLWNAGNNYTGNVDYTP